MATGNSINANQAGIQSYDGAGTWQGRVLASGTANLTITNPDGIAGNPTFTISGFTSWTDVTGTTQAMAVANGYVADNAALVTFTLPATANIGDMIQVLGKGAGGWKIAQNANQQINVGKVASTVGTGGAISSLNQFDTVELRCITAGSSTVWTAKVTGNVTVV
jgi:hypothetical protein